MADEVSVNLRGSAVVVAQDLPAQCPAAAVQW